MGLTVNRQMTENLTVNRQNVLFLTVNRQRDPRPHWDPPRGSEWSFKNESLGKIESVLEIS